MVSGGSGVLQRIREACRWPISRSTSAREKGAVIFASTDEVLPLVYRPNLSVRDVCTEAAVKVNISPVALDFFTLVSEDGSLYLNPDKMLSEGECGQATYLFKLCIKACHGQELRDLDKQTFEYYFHQCRQDFLRGKIGEFGANQNDLAKVILYEVVFRARERGVTPKVIIENPGHYSIKSLFQCGVFRNYSSGEIKLFLKEKVQGFEKLKDEHIKLQYVTTLERADDFFVHKLSFEKNYIVENVSSQRKFEILVSAEFGIKKRRTDTEKSLPEDIVKEFSEVEALEFDHMSNQITIIRKNSKPEILKASSPQAGNSLETLIQGYYRLMVNQYKQLRRGQRSTGADLLCHGPISREKAENILQKGSKEDGSFLLRRKRNEHSSYVLSVYVENGVHHYIIGQDTSSEPRTFRLESDPTKGFSSLLGLIEHYKQSKDGLPVCLSKIHRPKTEGLDALLDREVMTPALPDFHLVDSSVRISLGDLQIESEAMSKGEFGEVRKGVWWCSSGEQLQLNVASRALMKPIGPQKIKDFRHAMCTFLDLKNQHLTLLQGIAETGLALIFVFEFGNEGPLDRYIKEESKKEHGITKGRVISYAAQIAEGMMFLHSQNCVHGRLSAHNVLVADEQCVKISDYGLLHLVQNGQSFHGSRGGYGYGYCWFAPQLLQSHTFDFKSDIWAFGVTLWELFSMKRPFHCSLTNQVLTEKEVMERYITGRYLNPDRPNVPINVGNLMRRCCTPEPQDRLGFEDLVIQLRSPELVTEDEAQEVLLPPGINELEDWENPTVPTQGDMELQKLRADSQVSNVDYSCLPGTEPQDNSSSNDNTLPGISVIPSLSLFNSTILRKQSLSKTFSHPGLSQRLFEAEGTPPSRDPVSAQRKPSIVRVSSCPPAIEVGGHELCPPTIERHTRAVPNQEPNRDDDQATNANLDLPLSVQLELQVFGTCTENVDNVSSEEVNSSEDSSSDGDDGHSAEFNAEALAMKSLAGFVNASVMPTSSVAGVCQDEEKNNEESDEASSECGSSVYIRISTAGFAGGSAVPSLSSAAEDCHGEDHIKEESNETGTSPYINLSTTSTMCEGLVSGTVILSSSSAADVCNSEENSNNESNEKLSSPYINLGNTSTSHEGLMSESVMPSSSSADDVCHDEEVTNKESKEKSLAGECMTPPSSSSAVHEESDEHLSESGPSTLSSLSNTLVSLAGLGNGSLMPHTTSPADVFHCDKESVNEESDEQLSECGSSGYIGLNISSGGKSSQPAQTEKSRAGSYVSLSTTPRSSKPQGQAKGVNSLPGISTHHSTVEDSSTHAASPQNSSSNMGAVSSSLSRPDGRNVDQQLPGEDSDVSSLHMETLGNQGCSPSETASPPKDGALSFNSPDQLLASFSNLKLQNGVKGDELAEFMCDDEDSSVREGSSPLISDLQDGSDGDETDTSSRDDAELSLGKMFHTGFNRILNDDNAESDKVLDPCALSSFFGFELETMSEQLPLVSEDVSGSRVQFPAEIDMDNCKLFMGFLDREETGNHEPVPESSFSGENQEVFSNPCLDRDALLSNIASSNSAPVVPEFNLSTSELDISTDTREENVEENEEDDDDDANDNEMNMPSGTVRFSPGKVNFLNSPILMFDQGQETFEMKDFSLNNLSKESMKSTELLFFKDNQSVIQAMSSNQLDDGLSEDGCTLDDDLEPDDTTDVFAITSPYSCRADVDGRLKEINGTPPAQSDGGGYIRNEAHPVNGESLGSGYQKTPEPVQQEAGASLQTSSEGIWPTCDTTDAIVKRRLTGSCSSSGEDLPTVQLDMTKIPSNLQIPYEQLQFYGTLGRGQFGEVRRAVRRVLSSCWETPKTEDVAVKELKPNASEKDSSDFVKEVQNMIVLESKQQSRYIIKLRGVCTDPKGKLMLVTELAPLGALSKYLKDPKNKPMLGTEELLNFCMQICKGMRYLEDQSLLHRDLAARNILVMREDLVKISDFGLSRLQDYYKLEEIEGKRFLPVKWYALESLLDHRFTTKSDVWSFGVTMWEILSYGGEPYENYTTFELHVEFLKEGNRLLCPDKCPQKVYDVMKSCWSKDPMDRPSFFWLETNVLKNCFSNL